FGAYGEGDKPMLLGSAKNYAGEGIWTSAGDNLWKTSLKGGNAGIIVFDNAYALGVLKWNKDEIESNYDFYTDEDTETLYMYYSGDIADDFDSIEIGQRNYVMRVRSNAIVDNICVKYTGGHGIVMPTGTENSKVTNCEVGFIGGSKHTSSSRFGNGVELQLGVKHIELSNNYVYQCYDAGLTFQSWDSANQATYYDDLDISNNLVEFCYYGLEFFTTVPELGGSYSELHNISVKDNIFRFSGYAWSYKQRPDHWMTGHIRSSQRGWYEETENFVIEDNIFDCSRTSMIFWWWHDTKGNFVHPEPHPGVTVRGNSFYQTFTTDNRCMNYRYETPRYATDLKGLKDAVAVFDSTPQKVVWLDEI
ncbi:MAG: hypothetical protein J6T73_04760, partial [Clostridia bacterium]|nr:hypothetical protein [Clostridia bacterium]